VFDRESALKGLTDRRHDVSPDLAVFPDWVSATHGSKVLDRPVVLDLSYIWLLLLCCL